MKKLLSFFGDPNIGLYGKASDRIAVLSRLVKDFGDFFDTSTVYTTVANTDFVGLFLAFNSTGAVVPFIASEKEIKTLKKAFEDNLLVLKTKHTALGNLILTNDKGCIMSKLLGEKERKAVEDVLGVECAFGTIAGSTVVGSAAVANNNGCLIHRDASEEEAKLVSDVLKVPVDVGTVNFGSPFVASGLIVNSKHAWIGENTTGPELDRIIRTLKV